MGRDERFPPEARLRSSRAIRAVRRSGERRRSGPLLLFFRPSPAGRPRVAVVVPRHGRRIVDRNRVKRRLRELARREWLPEAREEGIAVDLVIQSRAEAYDASFSELRRAFLAGIGSIQWRDASSSD